MFCELEASHEAGPYARGVDTRNRAPLEPACHSEVAFSFHSRPCSESHFLLLGGGGGVGGVCHVPRLAGS